MMDLTIYYDMKQLLQEAGITFSNAELIKIHGDIYHTIGNYDAARLQSAKALVAMAADIEMDFDPHTIARTVDVCAMVSHVHPDAMLWAAYNLAAAMAGLGGKKVVDDEALADAVNEAIEIANLVYPFTGPV